MRLTTCDYCRGSVQNPHLTVLSQIAKNKSQITVRKHTDAAALYV